MRYSLFNLEPLHFGMDSVNALIQHPLVVKSLLEHYAMLTVKDVSLPQYTGDRETLGIDMLEPHLWEADDILRGNIDAADYKNNIFGLLFLRGINDRFEEGT
jgi:hypothetical protein